MSLVLGIDPGKTGALVALRYGEPTLPSGEKVRAVLLSPREKMAGRITVEAVWETAREFLSPGQSKREYLPDQMHDVISGMAERVELAVIETPSPPHPGTGGKIGRQVLGIGFGLWWMAMAANGIPRHLISPPSWMHRILRGAPGEGKERAVTVASGLIPDLRLPRAKARAQAIAEAACLAVYGIKYALGTPVVENEETKASAG